MGTLLKAFDSTVGRKLVMGLTGVGLVVFIILHLLGNLSLYSADGSHFNAYAAKLHSFGPLFTLGELTLVALFGTHIIQAIRVTLQNRAARPVGYAVTRSKGQPSHDSFLSRNMALTGTALLAFLILHIWQFRFGPGMEAGYVTQLDGKPAHDLHRLVVETFQQPVFVGIYMVVMVFLGMHLRHGFWSAFQSLGATTPKLSKCLYALGLVLAVLLAAGFLFIPAWLYVNGGKI